MPTSAFFSTPQWQSRLIQAQRAADEKIASNFKPEGFGNILNEVFEIIINSATFIDENCEFNIETVGKSMEREAIGLISSSTTDEAERSALAFFAFSYRLISEADIQGLGKRVSEIQAIHEFVDATLESYTPGIRRQLSFALYSMPVRIIKRLIADPSIVDFRNFANSVKQSRIHKKNWDDEYSKHTEKLDALSKNIKNLASEYNFVGLVNGFKNLRSQKNRELKWPFATLITLGLLIIATPLAQFIFVTSHIETIDGSRTALLYTIPSLVAAELFALYFFRVVLLQFRSVKAQLLQLDLRIALCQFIEGYSEYAKSMRKSDGEALSRFEALIFSGLVTDETNLPSTFDGLDQIANIVKSIRSN